MIIFSHLSEPPSLWRRHEGPGGEGGAAQRGEAAGGHTGGAAERGQASSAKHQTQNGLQQLQVKHNTEA